MKKTISIIISLLFALCFIPTVFAGSGTTYYIDSEAGSDSASGTGESSAWATAAHLADITFAPGDSILFKRGGTYDMTLSVKGSGTQDSPITMGAYGDESAALPLLTTSGTGTVLTLNDVSYWTLKDIQVTAPEGTGILIEFTNAVSRGITLNGVVLHDCHHYASDTWRGTQWGALRIQGAAQTDGAHIEDLTIDGCELYNCGYGICTNGNEDGTPAKPRNKNIRIVNTSVHDIIDDGMILGWTDNLYIDNCTIINCSQSTKYFTAPIWFTRTNNSLYQNCEVAGAVNYLDGMSVDFDDQTDNTTAQYIYSHDNCRFVWSCMWNASQQNNTVRYCLSVNDKRTSNGGQASTGDGYASKGFKFYNNTIVGCRTFQFYVYPDAVIKNNIFIFNDGEWVKYLNTQGKTSDVSNNLYDNVVVPAADKNAFYGSAGFASDDRSDKNSFMLSKSSQLIGKGVQVESDMGSHDFFGNALTQGMTHNIGCYEGAGTDTSAPAAKMTFREALLTFVSYIVKLTRFFMYM